MIEFSVECSSVKECQMLMRAHQSNWFNLTRNRFTWLQSNNYWYQKTRSSNEQNRATWLEESAEFTNNSIECSIVLIVVSDAQNWNVCCSNSAMLRNNYTKHTFICRKTKRYFFTIRKNSERACNQHDENKDRERKTNWIFHCEFTNDVIHGIIYLAP